MFHVNVRPTSLSRRRFLARGAAVVAGVTTVGAVGYGLPVALSDPAIRRVRIVLPRLDPRASGVRIAERALEGPDVAKALGWDRSRALVMLAHQPAKIDEVAAAGVDLQLFGHIHGGQIFPFGLLVKALEGTVAGLSRVGAPPGISIVELTR